MSYRGLVLDVPLGGGLYGGQGPQLAPPGSLLVARNVDFSSGTIRKEGGARLYNYSAAAGTSYEFRVTQNGGTPLDSYPLYPTVTVAGRGTFGMGDSPHIAAGGANTTAQLTPPAGKTTGDFVAGRIQDDENPADAVDITLNDYTELEWCVRFTQTNFGAEPVSAGGSIINGHDWWPDSFTQRMIVLTGTKLLRDTGNGQFLVTLASGLSPTEICQFVEGGKEAAASSKKLFIFTGSNPVKVLSGDGTSVTNLATPPAEWANNYPSFGVNHEGRLWGGGNANDPHRIYYSSASDHEVFTGAGTGSILVFPGEGQRLVGAVSFKGLLIVWKYPRGIYVIDTRDPDTTKWKVTRHSSELGLVNPLAFAVVEDDIVFVDQLGQLQQISAVQEFGSIGSRNLTDLNRMNDLIRGLFAVSYNASKIRLVYYAIKRELHIAMPLLNSTVNNRRLVLDLNAEPRWRLSDRDVCVSLWTRLDTDRRQQLVAGDDNGFVWLLDQTTYDKNGSAYVGEFQTAYLDFSHVDPALAARRKLGQFLELDMAPTGIWDVEVEIYWDAKLTQRMTFSAVSSGGVLDDFVLDEDVLADIDVQHLRRRIVGSGKTFSVLVRNKNAGEAFDVVRMRLYCTLGDE